MINDKPTYEELENQIKHLQKELDRYVKADYMNVDFDNEINFHDLFNINEIQKIQDLFAEATGVASIITYPNGIPITKPSNFCRLCIDVIRKTEKGLKNCYYSDAVIGKQNIGGAICQPCLSGGLWDGGASISVDGKHIANWLIGQVKNEEIDEHKMLLYAKEIGANETEFKNALAEVSVMSTEKFKKIADTLFYFANEISQKAYHNIVQKRLIVELQNKEKELLSAKEKAEESKINIQTVLSSTNDIIATYDPNICLQTFNEACTNIYRELFGIEIYQGLCTLNLFPEPTRAFWDLNNKRALAGETFAIEINIPTAKGERIFEQHYNPIFIDGKVVSFSTFARDITERKQLDLELVKAKERAEESDRLKTAFLQNMSHEIRTPLNAISGFAGFLNDTELSEEKRASFVQIIQNSSNQLIAIVSDILTISSLETKQEKISITNVCVNSVIVELLAIFKQQTINRNLSLYSKQSLNDKQSEILTDKTKITQILSNLISNALKFTHEGFIEFGYNLKDGFLEFYVKDSGIGIKPEFHEKIFERFRQADKSINKFYGGTGLGLAISKAFVELLGGKIRVKSEPEKGSTFYFTIPYKAVNKIDEITSETKQEENFKTVLVAEDEEYNFLFIEVILNKLNVRIIHTKDGKETVETFKANPNIDLILMDIKMPIMTGYEAAKIIKSIKPDLPIVAQSAYALENELAKYAGIFDDYLTKPIKEDDLKQKMLKYVNIKKDIG